MKIFIHVDCDSFISSKMMNYLSENTLGIEHFSIDEAFCEVTGLAELNKLSLEKCLPLIEGGVLLSREGLLKFIAFF